MGQVITLTLVFLLFAVFLQVVSVTIPYWMSYADYNIGLWQTCNNGTCLSNEDYFKAFQGLQVLGLITGICSIATLLIGKITNLLRLQLARRLSACLCITTGAIILIGIIVFSVDGLHTSACYAMSIFSAFGCGILGGLLTVTDKHERKRNGLLNFDT